MDGGGHVSTLALPTYTESWRGEDGTASSVPIIAAELAGRMLEGTCQYLCGTHTSTGRCEPGMASHTPSVPTRSGIILFVCGIYVGR